MTYPDQLSNPPSTNWPVQANENGDALAHVGTYARRVSTSSGLTWGYYGGRWGGFSVADGTLTLANGATNYAVVLRSNGVISVSTSNTNWNNTAAYARVYQVTTSGGAVTAVEDHRGGTNGVHGMAAASSGAGMTGLTFTSDTASQADSDPGAGKLRWNNATQGSATKLFIDDSTADGVSLATYFGSLGAAGEIFIQQADDAARWQLWRWTAIANDTGYRDVTVTLQAKSTSDIQDAKTLYLDFEEDDSGATGTAGKHAIFISAAAMRPSATGGCAALAAVATSTNQPDLLTLDFDATTEEYAQFSVAMPKSWNEGTITFKAYWSHPSTTTNFGVAWKLQGVAVSDDDAIAAAYGTAVAVTDTGGTTSDLYVTAESSAITIAGTPAAEDMVFFRIFREPSNGSDTMAVDARLHGITLFITTDAETDA